MDDMAILLEMSRRSLAAGSLLTDAFAKVQSPIAKRQKVEILSALLSAQRSLLDFVIEHRARFPHIGATSGYAQPVVNSMLMLADELDTQTPDEADALRNQARTHTEQYLGHDQQVDLLRNLATSSYTRGDFARALDYMFDARELAANVSTPLRAARITLDRVDLLQLLGDIERAEDGLSEIAAQHASGALQPTATDPLKRIEQQVEVHRIEFDLAFQSALLSRARGRTDEARRHVGRAVEAGRRLGQAAELAETQFVRLCLDEEKPDEAEHWLDKVEPVLLAMAPHKRGVTLSMRGQAELQSGALESAEKKLKEAVAASVDAGDIETEFKARRFLAKCHAQSDRADDASRQFVEACRTVDRLRRAPLGYRLDSCFLLDKYAVFEQAIEHFVAQRRAVEALEVMELVKSRRLTASLAAVRTARDTEQAALLRDFIDVSRVLDAHTIGARSGSTRELEARRVELLDELRRKDPRLHTLTLPRFDIPDLQASLARLHATAIGLFLLGKDGPDQRLVAALVSGDELRIDQRAVSAELRTAVDAFVENLRRDEPDPGLYDFATAFERDLEDVLPAAMIDSALAKQRLIVAPHRSLHLLPWACLQRNGVPMFERTAVGVVPCLSCIPAIAAAAPTQRPRAAFFGPPTYRDSSGHRPIDNLRDELGRQREAFGSDASSAWPKGRDASVAAIQEALSADRSDAEILVVACHGAFDSDEPMRSGLELSDGRLDAAWISQVRVGYREIVLRACSTGDRVRSVGTTELVGDDILGLPGSFLEAGVPSVLVSVPRLAENPNTRSFFDRYLRGRREGASPLLALRAAQQAAWQNGDDPSDWCGLTVYGVR